MFKSARWKGEFSDIKYMVDAWRGQNEFAYAFGTHACSAHSQHGVYLCCINPYYY